MYLDWRVLGVLVSDPFGARHDASMPCVLAATDPDVASSQLRHCLADSRPDLALVSLEHIRVTRYRVGRRCIVEYGLKVARRRELFDLALIGKIRAKGTDDRTFRVARALHQCGFEGDSADGISTPRAVGTIREFNMWLQEKVRGQDVFTAVNAENVDTLANRIAACIHKLHSAGPVSARDHAIHDEYSILETGLLHLISERPLLERRLRRVLKECGNLLHGMAAYKRAGIHRDFYPDHTLVHDDRIFLIDLDLYSMGDPALDVGNYIAHLYDWELRNKNSIRDAGLLEEAIVDNYEALAGCPMRQSIKNYVTVAMARLIGISHRISARRQHTESILEMFEGRLCR